MPTIGDKAEQSYGWQTTLENPVPTGTSVKIRTPGIDSRYTDIDHTDVTAVSTNKVYRAGRDGVEVAFDMTEGNETVDVTNNTGLEWPIGDVVYVYCPHLLAEGNNEWDLKGQIWDLQQRVSDIEQVFVAEDPEKAQEYVNKIKARVKPKP